MNFGEKLKYLRKVKGTTTNDVANYLNITRSAYSNYEQGIRLPDYNILKRLCDYFDVSADYMIGRENEDGTKI